MNPLDKIAAIMAAMNAVVGFGLYVVERSTRRRLDEQSLRLAEIEHHVGLTPLFPLDVECPICEAAVREPCCGGRGVAHSARFDVSPGVARAQLMHRIDQAIGRRLREEKR